MTLLAAAVFLILPAPTVAVRINFLARAGSGGSVPVPGALAGDAGKPSELSRPGSPSGPTRVGGYLGFANSLDTALRGKLSHAVVMRVRAERPSYWVGETFDSWDGESWSASTSASRPLTQRIAARACLWPRGATPSARRICRPSTSPAPPPTWCSTPRAPTSCGSRPLRSSTPTTARIVSPIGLGRGAIYTVESVVNAATPSQLSRAVTGLGLPPATQKRYTELPHPYPQAHALAQSVTAGATTTYGRVEALIAWIGANTRYSTDIPAAAGGRRHGQ